MHSRKNVLAISGSTRENSVNEVILKWMAARYNGTLAISIYNRIAELPHFRSDLVLDNTPEIVKELYQLIAGADGVLICTPEYVFSLPGSLKNALEWTVSTTLFTDKPVALIVASSLGHKAFESLQLIMKTLGANINREAALLLPGVKSKISEQGQILDEKLLPDFDRLVRGFLEGMEDLM